MTKGMVCPFLSEGRCKSEQSVAICAYEDLHLFVPVDIGSNQGADRRASIVPPLFFALRIQHIEEVIDRANESLHFAIVIDVIKKHSSYPPFGEKAPQNMTGSIIEGIGSAIF